MQVRDEILGRILAVYKRFGYQRIETPAIESIDRLTGGQGGENEKLIYRIVKRGLPPVVPAETPVDELIDLGLRFDLTVPLSRFYANNGDSLRLPFRSIQTGPVWRAERPQRGRFRQFIQCDIDIVGEPTVLAEIELIEATTAALAAVGLEGVCVRLSDRRLLTAIAETAGIASALWPAFFITLDKLDRVGWAGVRSELGERAVGERSVARVEEIIAALAGCKRDDLEDEIAAALPALDSEVLDAIAGTAGGLDQLGLKYGVDWTFDPTLVRGMGYYTGQIFEVTHPDLPGSIAGGGRYDRLIEAGSGRSVPACGFSIGFERIAEAVPAPGAPPQVALLAEADLPVADALRVARELRRDGQRVAVLRRSGKLGSQLTRLGKWSFSAAVLVGRGEDGETTVRHIALDGSAD